MQKPRDPGRRPFWLTLFSLAVAVTVLLPPLYVAVDRWSHNPNLARLLGDGPVLIGCWLAQQFLRHLDHPDGAVRRRGLQHWAILVVALIALTGIFASASATDEALDFIGRYRGSAFFVKYELVFLGYLGLTSVPSSRTMIRHLARTVTAQNPSPWPVNGWSRYRGRLSACAVVATSRRARMFSTMFQKIRSDQNAVSPLMQPP
ncbi:MAG: hypothetical protein ACRDIY_10065 [Chloroflexota bacterium]